MNFLNKKHIKRILAMIKDQYGYDFPDDYGFTLNEKSKVFIVSRDVAKLDFEKLRINKVGLYIAEINDKEVRISIEGSQIIGPHAKKGILELNEAEARAWMRGEDLEKETEKGFPILKYKNDFLGSGRSNGEKIFNYVPKTRRLNII